MFSLFKTLPRLGFRTKSLPFKRVRAFSDVYVNHRDTPDNNDSVPFDFTADNYKEIDRILAKYPKNYKKSAVIPLLHLAQKQNDNFLPISAMKKIAKVLGIAEMDVYEVASFYTMFNRTKVGKYHLQICATTPCMLCGAYDVIKAIENHVGCKLGETSPDGFFTLQEVECLGACANAPMLQVNGEWVYEDLTPENVIGLLEKLKNGEEVRKGPVTNRNHCEGPLGRTSLINFNQEQKYDRDFDKAKEEYEAAKLAAKQAAQNQAKK